MVISKRQMKVESDRYGGYGNTSAQADSLTAHSDVDYDMSEDILLSDRATEELSILRNQNAVQKEQAATVTAEPKKPHVDLPKRPDKEKKKLSLEDLMPSIKTRAYMSDDVEEEEQVQEEVKEVAAPAREHYTVSRRAKVAALVYLAVAIALAIAVISVGVSISQTSATVDALTASIAQKQTTLAAGEAELASKLDEDAIRQAAEELGMVSAGQSDIDIPLVEKSDYPTPEEHTNGFDKFADWLWNFLQ